MLVFVVICGLVAIAYGVYASRAVLAASPGNERMQEIAAAIQEGAAAYLNRQYTAIAIVGAVIAVVLYLLLGWQVAAAYLVGASLSGVTGYIGMHISVRANVRTTEAARTGLAEGLAVSFRAGSVTGMLVAGLALLAVTGTYWLLLIGGASGRELVDPLVGLGFGASLISIFARLGGGVEADDVAAGARRAFGAGHRMDAVPQRRVGFLVGPHQDRHVVEGAELPTAVQPLLGEAGEDQLDIFLIDAL